MKTETVEQQYRLFLLVVSGFIFFGTVIELLFIEHYESALQFVPFGLCAVGLITVLAGLFNPSRSTLKVLRYLMPLIAAGSLLGVYEHIEHNFEFALEIHPTISSVEALWLALYGASPLLAPGILLLGALLAFAATWKHPKLGNTVN